MLNCSTTNQTRCNWNSLKILEIAYDAPKSLNQCRMIYTAGWFRYNITKLVAGPFRSSCDTCRSPEDTKAKGHRRVYERVKCGGHGYFNSLAGRSTALNRTLFIYTAAEGKLTLNTVTVSCTHVCCSFSRRAHGAGRLVPRSAIGPGYRLNDGGGYFTASAYDLNIFHDGARNAGAQSRLCTLT